MKPLNKQLGKVALLALALAGTSACKTVVRENIISSINTGIGISLAENPKTELYEAKVGYIRSQFYSIPTGKMVEKDRKAKGTDQAYSNDAQKTPNVVSGIRFNSDLRHLMLGATISENFAVGDLAVNSKAATAMYIAESKSDAAAQSASEAVKGLASPEEMKKQADQMELQSEMLKQLKAVYDANAAAVAGTPTIPRKRETMLTKAKELELVHESTTEANLMKRLAAAADEKQATTDKLNEVLKAVK